MENYIESLLHEMIHAIIQIYTCSCDDCGSKYESDEGKTGHGRTWQTIAHEVEKFCCNELGLDLDLDRPITLGEEIHADIVEKSDSYDLDCELIYAMMDQVRLEQGLFFWSGHNDQKDNNIGGGKEGFDG
jgi:hypothetical protein